MRISFGVLCALGIMSSVTAVAQTGQETQSESATGNRAECTSKFRAIDRNGDGKLTGAELSGAALPANVAKQPNGDVTEVDYVSACSSQTPLGRPGQ